MAAATSRPGTAQSQEILRRHEIGAAKGHGGQFRDVWRHDTRAVQMRFESVMSRRQHRLIVRRARLAVRGDAVSHEGMEESLIRIFDIPVAKFFYGGQECRCGVVEVIE